MNILLKILLVLLVILAAFSGFAKVQLMPQEVAFFSKHGFNNTLIIVLGVAQILGAIFMATAKLRLIGASIVMLTFGISLVLLLMNQNYLMSVITSIVMLFLSIIIKNALTKPATDNALN